MRTLRPFWKGIIGEEGPLLPKFASQATIFAALVVSVFVIILANLPLYLVRANARQMLSLLMLSNIGAWNS